MSILAVQKSVKIRDSAPLKNIVHQIKNFYKRKIFHI